VTVTDAIYQKAKEMLEKENEKAGFQKYRSVSHFVEERIMSFKSEKE